MRCVLLILWISYACLAETPPSQLSESGRDQALHWLLSPDPDTRRKAHQALSQLGERESGAHRDLLAEARRHHSEAFERLLKKSYANLKGGSRGFRDWQRRCQEVLKFAGRKLGKDKEALRRLAQMRDKAAAGYEQVVQFTRKAESVVEACESQAAILLELEMEIALLQGKEAKAFALTLERIFDRAPYGDNILAIRGQCQSFGERRQRRQVVEGYNQKGATWPSDSQRAFARILNESRAHLGLQVLYLQKELCQASSSHSQEMQRLRYFSHTSPTPKNRSFPMRAANARYPGRAQGENIYMGSPAPQAAFDAWWKSDGHRRIMLEQSPNHLGIGVHKTYWTMNVGRGQPPRRAVSKYRR